MVISVIDSLAESNFYRYADCDEVDVNNFNDDELDDYVCKQVIVIGKTNIMITSVIAKPYLLLQKHPPKAIASFSSLDIAKLSPLCVG